MFCSARLSALPFVRSIAVEPSRALALGAAQVPWKPGPDGPPERHVKGGLLGVPAVH